MLMSFRKFVLIALGVAIAGCASPTPIAQVAPTTAATATTAPVTAIPAPTNTPIPTATPLPTVTPTVAPTDTPLPTATTVPTKAATATKTATKVATKVATSAAITNTAKATNVPTKAPTTASSQPVASIGAIPAGAPLNAAVQRSFQTAQGILGELNNVLAGRSSKCDDLLAMYNLFATAPTYDVSKQSTDVQTAYGLYREGVDTINSTAPKVNRICGGQGGGVIDKIDLGLVQKSAGQAVGLFGRAIDLLPPVTATLPAPKAAPTATRVASSIALSDLLVQTMDRLHVLGSYFDGAQTNLDANFCAQFQPLYNTIITEVALNQDGKAAAWIDSYGAYKVVIQYTQSKIYRAYEVCQAGGGAIGKSEFGEMRRAIDVAAIAAARAYDVMKKANLLGQ